jgi:hypothetical protein
MNERGIKNARMGEARIEGVPTAYKPCRLFSAREKQRFHFMDRVPSRARYCIAIVYVRVIFHIYVTSSTPV